MADIRSVVTSDDVKAVPANLNKVLTQVETLLAELEREQTILRLTQTIDVAMQAMSGVQDSVAGVPELIEDLANVATKANDLPLEEFTTRLSTLLESADMLLRNESVQELPDQLNLALLEINKTLRDLREGGAINNVNATLASARDAADAVAISTRDLPALVARLTQVLEQASVTIKGYDKGAVISRDAQSALRGVEQAANAITSLARTLERNPGALLRGR